MSLKINFICTECHEKNTGYLSLWEYEEPPKNENALLLIIQSCESCGIYGVYTECLKCGTELDLMD